METVEKLHDFQFDFVLLKYVEVYGTSPAGVEFMYTGLINKEGKPHGYGRR